MVSETDASTTTVETADGGSTTDSGDDLTYDVVYRATRDAMWDVVGTATLVLFYVALAGIGLSLAWTGLGFGIGPVAVGLGLVGLVVCLFSVYRIYVLATE